MTSRQRRITAHSFSPPRAAASAAANSNANNNNKTALERKLELLETRFTLPLLGTAAMSLSSVNNNNNSSSPATLDPENSSPASALQLHPSPTASRSPTRHHHLVGGGGGGGRAMEASGRTSSINHRPRHSPSLSPASPTPSSLRSPSAASSQQRQQHSVLMLFGFDTPSLQASSAPPGRGTAASTPCATEASATAGTGAEAEMDRSHRSNGSTTSAPTWHQVAARHVDRVRSTTRTAPAAADGAAFLAEEEQDRTLLTSHVVGAGVVGGSRTAPPRTPPPTAYMVRVRI
jgi:hypothetical protein